MTKEIKTPAAAKTPPATEFVNLSVKMPQEIHRRLKANCALAGVNIQDFVVDRLTELVEAGR